MKFGTFVDLTKKWRMQKKFWNSHYLWSYDHFKKMPFLLVMLQITCLNFY